MEVKRAKCTLPMWPHTEGDLDQVEGHDLVLPKEPIVISEVPWDVSHSKVQIQASAQTMLQDDEASQTSAESVDVRDKRAVLDALNRALLRARAAEDAVEVARPDAE